MNTTTLRDFQFFRDHAGYVVGRRTMGAIELARAERGLCESDLEFVTMPESDVDDSWMSDQERELDHEWITAAIVRPCAEHGIDCRHTEYIAALGNICDADRDYIRVLRAELALQAKST
jgi:hypothetical protein